MYVGGLDAALLDVVGYHKSGYLLSMCAGEQRSKTTWVQLGTTEDTSCSRTDEQQACYKCVPFIKGVCVKVLMRSKAAGPYSYSGRLRSE